MRGKLVGGIIKDNVRKQSGRIMRGKKEVSDRGDTEGRESRCRIRWDNVRSAASALLCSSLIFHFICRGCGAKRV